MATNLRLRPDAEEALRAKAAAVGRSQQELIREAIDRYLGLIASPVSRTVEGAMLATGLVLPARTGFRELGALLPLPAETSTLRMLDREDRV